MQINKKLNNTTSIVVTFLCTIVILIIFLRKINDDYYYHFTQKKTRAKIELVKEDKGYKPIVATLSYYNEYLKSNNTCYLRIEDRFGNKLILAGVKNVEIVYTKNNPCDIYILEYKHPTLGIFILHIILLLIAFAFTCYQIIKILKSVFNKAAIKA